MTVAALTLVMTAAGVLITGSGKTAAEESQASAETAEPMIAQIITPVEISEEIGPEADQEPEEEQRFYYDIPLSHQLQDVVFLEAERWNVPPELLLAMMDQESDYRTDAVSNTGDFGIMQINEVNHQRLRDEIGVTDFMDPAQSIACGAYMIGELLEKYDGDMHHALTAYNRGEGGAQTYYRSYGTYETEYSRNIVATYEDLGGGGQVCR